MVHRANWRGFEVAVKVLIEDNEAPEREEPGAVGPSAVELRTVGKWRSDLERETGVLRRLSHPNCVRWVALGATLHCTDVGATLPSP